MYFNATTGHKTYYYQTQFNDQWWDNGSLPIWITAQRQVCLEKPTILLQTGNYERLEDPLQTVVVDHWKSKRLEEPGL